MWDIMFELASLLLLLQNMLLEIEEKVSALSELEGQIYTRQEAERLAAKLHTLKSGLLDLHRLLQDKQLNLQVRCTCQF